MLTTKQFRKLALVLKAIERLESEIDKSDSNIAELLADAADACNEVLTDDLPKSYDTTTLPEKRRVRHWSENCLIMLAAACQTFVFAALVAACFSLGYWGAAEYNNSNIRIQSELKSESRAYLGLTEMLASAASASYLLFATCRKK